MNTVSHQSHFVPPSLEARADELCALLNAGMDGEFERQFQRAAKILSADESDQLITLINSRLKNGCRKRQLKLVVSERASEKKITIMDSSRFFGSSWSIARQTFAV